MKGLKIVLWISGILMLLDFVGMLIPLRFLVAWSRAFGVDMFLDPMTSYMVRMCQAMCGLVGVFLIILAKDPLKYGPMVLLAGYGSIFLGLVVLVAVVRYALPQVTYIGAVLCVVVGLLILVFRGKALQEQGGSRLE
jgi:hypothetical protein